MAFDQSEDGLLATYSPQNRGLATSSGPQADGAGMKLAQKVWLIFGRCLFAYSRKCRWEQNWSTWNTFKFITRDSLTRKIPLQSAKFWAPKLFAVVVEFWSTGWGKGASALLVVGHFNFLNSGLWTSSALGVTWQIKSALMEIITLRRWAQEGIRNLLWLFWMKR